MLLLSSLIIFTIITLNCFSGRLPENLPHHFVFFLVFYPALHLKHILLFEFVRIASCVFVNVVKESESEVAQSCPTLFVTPWTVAHQAPPSMGFSRQEYWSGLPFPSPGDLPNPGIEPTSPALQAYALTSEPPGKPICSVSRPWRSGPL